MVESHPLNNPAPGLSPLRGTFVGRQWEMGLLKAALDDALSGKGRLVRVEYFWTCTPSLLLYVFDQDPEIECITYVDADLFFYTNPQPIYEEFGSGSRLGSVLRVVPLSMVRGPR